MIYRVLLALIVFAGVEKSHSETKARDIVLSYAVDTVSFSYWKLKNPQDFIEEFGEDLSSRDLKFMKEVLSTATKLPKLSIYERGWVLKLDKTTVRIDLLNIRKKIIYVNGEKLFLDFAAPLEYQVELINRKLSIPNKKDSYSLIELLLPTANAETEELAPSRPHSAAPVAPEEVPKGKVGLGRKAFDKLVHSKLVIGIALLGVAKAVQPKVVDTLAGQALTSAGDGICWLVTTSEAAIDAGLCSGYLKKLDDDPTLEPRRFLGVGASKLPQGTGQFFTPSPICPHESSRLERPNTLFARVTVLDNDFKYRSTEQACIDPDAPKKKSKPRNIPDRVFRVVGTVKDDNLVNVDVYECGVNIARLKYQKSLQEIQVLNVNRNPGVPSFEPPVISLDPKEKIVGSDSVQRGRLEGMRQLSLSLNAHIDRLLKDCAEQRAKELEKNAVRGSLAK